MAASISAALGEGLLVNSSAVVSNTLVPLHASAFAGAKYFLNCKQESFSPAIIRLGVFCVTEMGEMPHWGVNHLDHTDHEEKFL